MLTNIIMLTDQNKFFKGSKAHHIKSGFSNPYLAIEFEKKKFSDFVRLMKKDLPDPEYEKL